MAEIHFEKIYIFVYGTLKKGHENHHFLKNDDTLFIGKAKTMEKFIMYFNRYPFVSKDKALYHIHGELYQVNERVLKKIDDLEGHPNWYVRKVVKVVLGNGKVIDAFMYFNENEKGHVIPSGRF